MRFLPFPLGVGWEYLEEPHGFTVKAFSLYPASDTRPGYAQKPAIELSPRWLEQAELVIVRTTREGSVERVLEARMEVR